MSITIGHHDKLVAYIYLPQIPSEQWLCRDKAEICWLTAVTQIIKNVLMRWKGGGAGFLHGFSGKGTAAGRGAKWSVSGSHLRCCIMDRAPCIIQQISILVLWGAFYMAKFQSPTLSEQSREHLRMFRSLSLPPKWADLWFDSRNSQEC